MSAPVTLPPELQAHVDLGALLDWMDARGLGSGSFEAAVPLTGGTQNILLRLTRSGRDYVFRRTPPNPRAYSNEALRREARVLAALAGTGVPHPALIAGEPDEGELGYVFLLMEPIDGFNPGEGLPAFHRASMSVRRMMGESYVDALAALAEVDVDAVGLSGFGKPDGFLERQVPQWTAQLERYASVPGWAGPEKLGDVAHIADWLTRHRPEDAAPGLIHGDCHLGNTMYPHRSGQLAALIDWEMSTVGDPRLDLGWVMATWPGDDDTVGLRLEPREGFPALDELVARYAARTSRPLDAAPWFGVMACFKLAVLLEGTHVRALAGKADSGVGERLHGMAVRLMARARCWAE